MSAWWGALALTAVACVPTTTPPTPTTTTTTPTTTSTTTTSTTTTAAPPVVVTDSLGSDYYNACAHRSDGTVLCIGQNTFGQLGTAATGSTRSTVPVQIAGLADVTSVASGQGSNLCALLADATMTCWGANDFGQNGNATNNGVALGVNAVPTPVAGLAGLKQLAVGQRHTCALRTDGTVACFGYNGHGQLGSTVNNSASDPDPAPKPNPTPATVAGLTGVTTLAAGKDFTCASRTDGTVACFGLNYNGQLGNSTNFGRTSPNPAPLTIPGLDHVRQVVAGYRNACALKDDGTVLCWGSNVWGEAGNTVNNGQPNGSNPTPTVVPGLSGVTSLSFGHQHACAVTTGGVAKCWGSNSHGELGGTPSSTNPTPYAVPGLPAVTEIMAFGWSTCALTTTATVYCFGENSRGQLGNTTNIGQFYANPTPALVNGF